MVNMSAKYSAAKQLFLSYGREPEVVAFVSQLKHDLERNGFSVWLDAEDIPAGCDWHGAIGTGLDGCQALIAVITHKYIASRSARASCTRRTAIRSASSRLYSKMSTSTLRRSRGG